MITISRALLSKLSKLNSKQLDLIESLVDELVFKSSETPPEDQEAEYSNKSKDTKSRRRSKDLVLSNKDSRFISLNQVSLEVNDRVKLLNTRRVGYTGDIGQVTKLNKKYVSVKLERNGKTALRSSNNLYYISGK